MNTEEIIQYVSDLVEEECKSESNIFGYEIWTYHIAIVSKYAKLLADILGADKEIVELSALLHDYASIKNKGMYEEHHIYGAVEAERLLRKLKYPENRIDRIKECIMQHRGSVSLEKTTKESICVASADAMSHIDQVPSLLYLAYVKKGLGVGEGAEWVRKKIERSWSKLCPEAQEIIMDKYDSARKTLA